MWLFSFTRGFFVFPCSRPQRGFSPLHALRGQCQTLLGLPKIAVPPQLPPCIGGVVLQDSGAPHEDPADAGPSGATAHGPHTSRPFSLPTVRAHLPPLSLHRTGWPRARRNDPFLSIRHPHRSILPGQKKSGQRETNPSSPWHGNGFLVQSDLPQGPCLGSMVPSHVGSNSRSGRLMGTILVIGLVVSG